MAEAACEGTLGKLVAVLFSPASYFSVASLTIAFLVAAAVYLAKRPRSGLGAAFSRAVPRLSRLIGRSGRTDAGYFLFNLLIAGALFGWAVVSADRVSEAVGSILSLTWRTHGLIRAPGWVMTSVLALSSFLVYEFAYWLDHYISHRMPFFWAFHRAHHTAEALSPLTVYRVHPIDGVKFANILAASLGIAGGVVAWALGSPCKPLAPHNAITLVFVYLVVHLQHSHVWLTFPGVWGKIFMSPAQHQLHHSSDPEHYGKNLGGCLSIFDTIFGTLLVADQRRPTLTFGADRVAGGCRGLMRSLADPFVEVAEAMRPRRASVSVLEVPANASEV